MKTDVENIQAIFDSLEVGLEGADVAYLGIEREPGEIDPSRFNRATVFIGGTSYTVSIFKPATLGAEQESADVA